MKRFTLYSSVAVLVMAVCCTACKDQAPEISNIFYPNDPQTIEQLTADGRLYTLDEFKSTFMTESGNYLSDTTLYRTRATSGTINGKYLFSMDTLPTQDTAGIYIMGRVATDDYGGNFYKALVIQQIVDGKQQALRISVDAGSISGLFPRGQMILIRCNGLAVGRYANQPQLCIPNYNNNVFADKANQKVGWAPGRIPFARFKAATRYLGAPDESALMYEEMTIADIVASYDILDGRNADGKLVRINNIHYSGQCLAQDKSLMYCTTGDPATDGNANVFAPTTGNVGYPQSRVIFDEEDENYICVSMSEYAKEAHFYIPGATGAEEADVFFYDSTAEYSLSEPYLLADFPTRRGCVVPVDARKEAKGWQVDDVVYMDKDKKVGYVYNGTTWSQALGVLHCSDYSGSIKGILSYYMDNASYGAAETNWAISICDLSDLSLKKADGTPWRPLEYTAN